MSRCNTLLRIQSTLEEERHFYRAVPQLPRMVYTSRELLKSLGGDKSAIQNELLIVSLIIIFFSSSGQNSSAGKLKTLFGALDIMAKTKCAFQLIRKDLAAESEQVNENQVI